MDHHRDLIGRSWAEYPVVDHTVYLKYSSGCTTGEGTKLGLCLCT